MGAICNLNIFTIVYKSQFRFISCHNGPTHAKFKYMYVHTSAQTYIIYYNVHFKLDYINYSSVTNRDEERERHALVTIPGVSRRGDGVARFLRRLVVDQAGVAHLGGPSWN